MMRDQRKWGNFSIPGKNVSFLDRTHTDALAYVGACAQPRTHREKRGDVGAARLLHEPHQRRPLEGHWEALNPQGPKCHAYTLLQCTHRWQRGEWVPLPPSGLGQLQVGATLSPSKTKKKKCTPRLPRQIECRLTELTVVKRTSDVVERRGGGEGKPFDYGMTVNVVTFVLIAHSCRRNFLFALLHLPSPRHLGIANLMISESGSWP